MCLIACAWKQHPVWSLVLWANRDEFRARPATPIGHWSDAPDLVGGRDLQEGGSWLLLSRRRRLAAVTNIRRMPFRAGIRSRGHLVSDFTGSSESAATWLDIAAERVEDYAPFNLLVWDGDALLLAGHQAGLTTEALAPGLHGISNGPMLASWAKSRKLVEAQRRWIERLPAAAASPELNSAWDALGDTQPQPDEALPDTGIGLDRERMLSSSFIDGEQYGTRASTVVMVGAQGWRMVERCFDHGRRLIGETQLEGVWG